MGGSRVRVGVRVRVRVFCASADVYAVASLYHVTRARAMSMDLANVLCGKRRRGNEGTARPVSVAKRSPNVLTSCDMGPRPRAVCVHVLMTKDQTCKFYLRLLHAKAIAGEAAEHFFFWRLH